MSTSKSYDSVTELVKDLVGEKEFAHEVENEIDKQSLATALFQLRCHAGLTQSELAKKAGYSQGYISKLEHASTENITVEALEKYSAALDVNLTITFQKAMSAVDSVKFHFFEIKKHLDRLVELSKDDDDIRKGVDDFYNEWLFNTFRHFKEGKDKLAASEKPSKKQQLRVVGPEDLPDDREFKERLQHGKDVAKKS